MAFSRQHDRGRRDDGVDAGAHQRGPVEQPEPCVAGLLEHQPASRRPARLEAREQGPELGEDRLGGERLHRRLPSTPTSSGIRSITGAWGVGQPLGPGTARRPEVGSRSDGSAIAGRSGGEDRGSGLGLTHSRTKKAGSTRDR